MFSANIIRGYSFNKHERLSNSFQLSTSLVQEEVNDTTRSRITPGVQSQYDWLKLLNGQEKEVEVRRISDKYVFYSQPDNMDVEWIDRREVQTIYYRTGKIEQMTQKAIEIRKVKDWQKIDATRAKEDVDDMIKVEDLQVKHEATNRHEYNKAKTLETSAEIILKKQAALLNADIILIVKVEHHRAYGDPPVVTMTAEAYRKREE
ncbi:MAG: hypothetical protein CVT95_11725 [Bacteroidetes bacterium HGW-Bacteroidetes-12]|nr:MAG: hypothetical protein CVT95_11725 [Bacteroidetes bacterium HGW-Bacteroidetes-12]